MLYDLILSTDVPDSVQSWIDKSYTLTSSRTCNHCGILKDKVRVFKSTLRYLWVHVPGDAACNDVSRIVEINTESGPIRLTLKGIIYYSAEHFTVRLIDRESNIWFHDGMTCGSQAIREGRTLIQCEDYTTRGESLMCDAIYVRLD
ncbi:hypothetical protein BKA70DRAFT_1104961 [Coprinopsis sp. MPI-PUGE-AT-0042]|nr:hypothetical protein BKA70DRAFT_1104961 [Coprinopsis sp. MPI-PUGE-AT-0042]